MNKLVWGAVIIAALLCGCVAPLSVSGGQAISIRLGGVIPNNAGLSDAGARVLAANATTVHIVITDENNKTIVDTYQSISGNRVSVRGVPANKTLNLQIDAICGTNILSTWRGQYSVKAGDTIQATLTPPTNKSIMPCDLVGSPSWADPIMRTVNKEDIVYFSVYNFPTTAKPGEYYVSCDSHNADPFWIGVYDQNWQALPYIASDVNKGWAVVSVANPAAGIRVAVANLGPGAGYYDASKNGSVSIRPALFISPNTNGSGTSQDPGNISKISLLGGVIACIMGSGNYNSSCSFGSNTDFRIYGGFESSNWAKRNGSTCILGDSAQYTLKTNGALWLDGLSITAKGIVSDYSSAAVYIDTAYPVIITNCIIQGYSSSYLSAPDNYFTRGLYINAATSIEVANCYIEGGSITDARTPYSVTSSAIEFGTNAINFSAAIHDSQISGGSVNLDESSANSAKTFGINLGTASGKTIVVAKCRIWGGSAINSGNFAQATAYNSNGSSVLFMGGSMISGGFAKATNTSGMAQTGGAVLSGSTTVIWGNAIDVGTAAGTGQQQSYGIAFGGLTPNAYIIGNACIGGSSLNSAVLYLSRSQDMKQFSENAICGQALNRNGTYTPLSTLNLANIKNNKEITASPTSVFVAYSAPTDFKSFLALDLHLKRGCIIDGSTTRSLDNYWSDFSSINFTSAFYFDLDGTQRLTTRNITFGAYEVSR